jgi:hypothetical protein
MKPCDLLRPYNPYNELHFIVEVYFSEEDVYDDNCIEVKNGEILMYLGENKIDTNTEHCEHKVLCHNVIGYVSRYSVTLI